MIDSENCPVTALFCAVYAREMTCYIPAAERTYTYPKTTFTRRYEHERITLHTCRGTAKQMAQVILEIIQEKVVYKRVPTCAYQIGSFTISKDGVLNWTEDIDAETVKAWLPDCR